MVTTTRSKTWLLIAILFLPAGLLANLTQVTPLSQVLDEISKRYEVFITYDLRMLDDFDVNFEFFEDEALKEAVDRALSTTNLSYKHLGEKYFVVFKDTKASRRKARKITKKFRQIDRLERSHDVSLEKLSTERLNTLTHLISSNDFLPDDQTITGTVTDAEGEPLIGATIQGKGTNKGTTTDVDGRYSITLTDDVTVIIVSYIGYQSLEVAIEGRTTIDISLTDLATELDEVVVVGYGTQKQKEVTSAIVSVKEEDFNKGNLNDPEQLLAGKVAGLSIAKVGGSPTQDAVLRLRGLSTFGANAEPLIVVDGVVGASLRNIDPNDIASIDVLKDASAGAIYGTRGSSGVIIITTKSGNTTQEPRLEVSAYTSLESISNLPGQASKAEFLAAGGVDFGFDTDWMDETTRTANTNVVNAAFSSNNGSTYYRASVNLRDIKGILNTEEVKQINTRLNLTQNLWEDRLRLTGIVSFTRGDESPGNKFTLRQALLWNPTAPIYVDGDPSKAFFETQEQSVFNPVAINEQQRRNNQEKRTLVNLKADLDVIDGLTLSANYSYQVENNLFGSYITSQSLEGNGIALNGVARRSTFDATDELIEYTASYTNAYGNDNTYTLLGGYSYQEQGIESFFAQNSNFITDGVSWDNLGLGQGLIDPSGPQASLGSQREENTLTSLFGRLNMAFADNFNASASIRREASSRFGENNRWGTFWALSASANLHNLFDLGNINQLKLRAGYGVTGNQPAQRYAFLETLGLLGQGYVNGEFISAIAPTSNPNPDLKWEEKGELNFGIDFALLDYRLTGTIDYYNRTTDDLLNTISVPSPPNLFNETLVNLGKLETNGFEVTLNYKAIYKPDFTWDIGLIYDRNETKLVKFNNLEAAEILVENLGTPGFNNLLAIRIKEGEPIGDIMAPQFLRFNEDGKAVVRTGEGGEVIATDAVATDYIVAGNGLPDFSINLTNSLTYRNFDFSFLWRGVFGHQVANLPASKLGHPVRAGQFRFIKGEFFNVDDTDDSAWHTEFVEDGDFFRLDNITFGYKFNIPQNRFFQNLRVYLTGNNLVTLTGYSGADPEPRYEGNTGLLAPGLDRLGDYFPTRSFVFGLNATF